MSLSSEGKSHSYYFRVTYDEKEIRYVTAIKINNQGPPSKITIDSSHFRNDGKALYVPSPWEQERGIREIFVLNKKVKPDIVTGQSIVELDGIPSEDGKQISPAKRYGASP